MKPSHVLCLYLIAFPPCYCLPGFFVNTWSKASNAVEFVKEQSSNLGASEKFSSAVEFVKEQSSNLGVSEKASNAVEFVKEQSSNLGVSEKFSSAVEFVKEQSSNLGVSEKASNAVEFVKEQSSNLGVSSAVEFVEENKVAIGAGIVGSAVAMTAGPPMAAAVVNLFGFGTGGVVAESWAAWAMSTFGTTGIIPTLQSLGAAGPGAATTVTFGWMGSLAGLVGGHFEDMAEKEAKEGASERE